MAKWTAHPLNMPEVRDSGPGLVIVDSEGPFRTSDSEFRLWSIHPGLKTHWPSQPKSEAESTSGSTK